MLPRKVLWGAAILVAVLASLWVGRRLYYGRVGRLLNVRNLSVTQQFTETYWDSQVWLHTNWLGIPSEQTPADNWSMQEIITEIKPDYVIETGTAHGGTSLFYASVLAMVNPRAKVITVDVDPQVEQASRWEIFRDRVEVIRGDSVSPQVVSAISKEVQGHTALVTLDSLHTKDHVLKEMELYSPFVSVGSYLVVQDTVVNGNPILPAFGPGPMEAVNQFLNAHSNFTPDRSREKFLLTFYPSGYLRRTR